MAKLSDFTTDVKAVRDGMWVRVDPARYGDLEIFTCGFTDEFLDAKNELEMAASDHLNIPSGRPLPNAEQRKINAELLERFLIKDVRNLTDENDQPITVQQFHRFMYLLDYNRLAGAAWQAAGRVSNLSAKQLESALGNSLKASRTSSNGEAYGTVSEA